MTVGSTLIIVIACFIFQLRMALIFLWLVRTARSTLLTFPGPGGPIKYCSGLYGHADQMMMERVQPRSLNEDTAGQRPR